MVCCQVNSLFLFSKEGTLYPKPSIQTITSSAPPSSGSQSTIDATPASTDTEGLCCELNCNLRVVVSSCCCCLLATTVFMHTSITFDFELA